MITKSNRTHFSASHHDIARRPLFRDYRSHTDPNRKALTCTDKEILLNHCAKITIANVIAKNRKKQAPLPTVIDQSITRGITVPLKNR